MTWLLTGSDWKSAFYHISPTNQMSGCLRPIREDNINITYSFIILVHPSIHLFCPCVCPVVSAQNCVHSVSSTILAGSISYLHNLSVQEVCCLLIIIKNSKIWFLLNIFSSFHCVLFDIWPWSLTGGWGLRAFLRWWPPSTMWVGPLIYLWPPPGIMCCMLSTFCMSSQIVANVNESSLLLSQ